MVALDLADLAPQAGALAGLVDGHDALTQDPTKRLPGALSDVDALERVHRGEAAGVDVEDLLVGARGRLGVADLVALQLGDLEQDLDLLDVLVDEA